MILHEHTWLIFDCRPMKGASHKAIDDFEAGRIDADALSAQLYALAASLPDLSPEEFQKQLNRLAVSRNFARMHRLVNALGDKTMRAWVRPSFAVVAVTCKLSALAAFVYVIVWLAK